LVRSLEPSSMNRFQDPSLIFIFVETPIVSLQVEENHNEPMRGSIAKGQCFEVEITLEIQRRYHFAKIPLHIRDSIENR